MAKMKIIVGLGNPGKEYENSRHNIGFRIVDFMSREHGGNFNLDKKLNSEISELKINGKKVLLVKPQTFVNKSGEAVKKLKFLPAGRHGKIENLVIVHDDLDIPFGKIRVSFGKSSAGHKGVESVIKALKTDKFSRVRFGTFGSQLAKVRKIKDKRSRLNEMNKFVVGPFSPNEKPKLNKLIKETVEKAIPLL